MSVGECGFSDGVLIFGGRVVLLANVGVSENWKVDAKQCPRGVAFCQSQEGGGVCWNI